MTKSIGAYIDVEGAVVMPILEKELEHFVTSMLRKD